VLPKLFDATRADEDGSVSCAVTIYQCFQFSRSPAPCSIRSERRQSRRDHHFAEGLLAQLISAGTKGQDYGGKGPNFKLSVIQSICARDETEAMLAASAVSACGWRTKMATPSAPSTAMPPVTTKALVKVPEACTRKRLRRPQRQQPLPLRL
jgi:hypothetical protein